jgi:hypothetical protein
MGSRCNRGARALSQPMYLMSACRVGEDWNFLVQGSRGTSYHVHVCPESTACTCPDFKLRRETCKHIYFMVGRVLGDVALMNQLEDGCGSQALVAAGFSDRIERRLRARLETSKTTMVSDADTSRDDEVPGEDGSDCVVCFEALAAKAWRCDGCRQRCMHDSCAQLWLRRTPSCPLCRHTREVPPAVSLPDSLASFTGLYS